MEKSKEFVWTDAKVIELLTEVSGGVGNEDNYFQKEINSFKAKKEVVPTVVAVNVKPNSIDIIIDDDKQYYFVSPERLASIVIAESKGEIFINEDKGAYKLFTEKEYLQFGEECFNQRLLCKSETAANVLRYLIEDTDGFFKYESFSDFMNSKNKQAF